MDIKNSGIIEFEAVIESAGGGGAFVCFPFDTEKVFGKSGRIPVGQRLTASRM